MSRYKKYVRREKRQGRPRLEVDAEQIFKLAQLGLTDTEIADLLQAPISVLQHFRVVLQEGRARLSKSIKRTQLEVALKERDKSMLIWVGKQYAGQREKKDLEHSGEIATPQVVFYGDEGSSGNDDTEGKTGSVTSSR